MARLIVMAVRDRAMDAFAAPFCVPAVQVAVRSFQQEVNRADEKNPMFTTPKDFELYELGEYDEASGRFAQYEQHPRMVARAEDFRKE